MVSLCLDTPSMYVLEIISRVGAIVELTLLAPPSHLRNPFCCQMFDVKSYSFIYLVYFGVV